ncbi:receptor-binding cancer antigen expressed on SiSo cells isoform X2 [Nilaparvata lugens]|uniref:receptor-binding cancer antigen expressed on SiSo cells isoform X1 n=1 Tax=Nilaparvata lugens TaxID=108931 RepID=UPI00193E2AB6|nr:receptor-binding cancer antigen expressed on SiSo cells isoform X1 [Nilaparvata lugens]XP_039277772.1 receptor-binding cancer antigen expressed on SiSo cells isoform X2 [Nilaparvata lugens]
MKMIINMLFNRVKALFFIMLGLLRRSLCCLRRRRKLSCDSDTLTTIGIIPQYESHPKQDELQNWSTWEDPVGVVTDHKPQTVQQHIEYYRQQANVKPQEEPQNDLFEDMTPQITRQTKILLRQENDQRSSTQSRLSIAQDSFVPSNEAELGSWEESEANGVWDEAEHWDTEQMIREKKRQERELRLAELTKKRLEREQLKTLGSRMS